MRFFDKNGFSDTIFDVFLDFFVGFSEIEDFCFIFEIIGIYGEFGTELAVNLDNNFDSIRGEVFFVPSWPFVGGV